jgi:ketosteroid isomerase-like protein
MKLAPVLLLALTCACSHDLSRESVAAAERARSEAIEHKDAAAYSRLVSPDFFTVDRDGMLATRDDRIAEVTSGEALTARRGEGDFEVRMFGNVAILMGRTVWQREGEENHDYFSRIWIRWDRGWQILASHYTDITQQKTSPSHSFSLPDAPVPALPLAQKPWFQSVDDVYRAIDEQHRAYWSKDHEVYRKYVGEDVLRVAENGVRTREQLISGMRGNSKLPAPPSQQHDVRVRLYGNIALATWLDSGSDMLGRAVLNRFTVVFGRRPQGWQMIHIQSTGVKQG